MTQPVTQDGEALSTICIVDDDADVRSLIKIRLQMSRRFDVVGEGGTGEDAVRLARRLRPDLMLLDVSMPQMDGLEALPAIRAGSPNTRVVMFTGFDDDALAERAKRLGARAVLVKSMSVSHLPERLAAVAGGADGEPAAPLADRLAQDILADNLDGERLAEHVERFREVFEQATIGIATMTLTGRVARTNAALTGLLGTPSSKLVGQQYAEFAGGAAPQVAQAIKDVLASGTSVTVEHSIHQPQLRQVTAMVIPILDARAQPLYLLLQVQDITSQRSAEAMLRQSEERLRLLIESVQDYAIIMLDPHGVIVSWNGGAERINGYPATEVVDRHFSVLYPPELRAAGHPQHELDVAARTGRFHEQGWRLRKDGTRFRAAVTLSAMRDTDDRLVGFAKVTRALDL